MGSFKNLCYNQTTHWLWFLNLRGLSLPAPVKISQMQAAGWLVAWVRRMAAVDRILKRNSRWANMFYGLNYTQEIERWSKGLHIHRWCTQPDQEAQKDIGAPHHCEMLRLSISANVTPEHAASNQVVVTSYISAVHCKRGLLLLLLLCSCCQHSVFSTIWNGKYENCNCYQIFT